MKGCAVCHSLRNASRGFRVERSLADLASILWNHAPMMMNLPPSLNREEIAGLTAHLWASHYFDETGNPVSGKEVFEEKRCNACHSAFPTAQPFDSAAMLHALWRHTPAVVNQANAKGISWPKFYSHEMADLAAYCDSLRPAPKPAAGTVR